MTINPIPEASARNSNGKVETAYPNIGVDVRSCFKVAKAVSWLCPQFHDVYFFILHLLPFLSVRDGINSVRGLLIWLEFLNNLSSLQIQEFVWYSLAMLGLVIY